ncbi:MAG TPA: Gfo/Idh/MocA family oxidoreductase [Candidatus Brocadiia bacterium]|nr:Gfo/Idh/MocA family oxidoreductase [Candidatus Brocadiia bacterium]
MHRKGNVSRRQFLTAAASAAFAPYIVTSNALGKNGTPSASNRIVMGQIGCGGMGNGDMGAFLGNPECQVVACCDVDTSRREDSVKTVNLRYLGNVCKGYNDFREIIARDDIDAVGIATPDHWHAIIAIAAAKAGKDMYCQKPLSLTVREGRVMSDTIKRYGVVFQTGSQQRSGPEFRFGCELVRNERIGKLHTIKTGIGGSPSTGVQPPEPVPPGFDWDMWLGQAPWVPYTRNRTHWNFRWILDYSGGNITDWGAHHNDIAQWGNGTMYTGPIEIEGHGVFPKEGLYNTATEHHTEYLYANGVKLICSNKNKGGVRFEGTEGWVHVDRGFIDAHPKSLLQSEIKPGEVHLYKSPGHYQNFIDCVKSRKETVAPVEIAHRSITLSHLANISMLLDRKLKWNPDKEQFIDDPEATRYLDRARRSPWTL